MKILVTGGSNGIGKGVARILAAADSHELILLCRSKANGEAAAREIADKSGNTNTSLVICDLAKLRDVKQAIREIQGQHKHLDALFVNAGLGYTPGRLETEDGMDCHFQVNYLSQFMLTLNLLELLENSNSGGRIVFNATNYGEIFWDDIQMQKQWSYERAIFQAMAAKRMFLHKLHSMCPSVSFIGYQVPKTVWSNQLAIIPWPMRIMASTMKIFGAFMSIDDCGREMAPLFLEAPEESLKKSGKLLSWKRNAYCEIEEKPHILDRTSQDRLWELSLSLCHDAETSRIADDLVRQAKT
jgi:hypothetical protein